MLNSGSTYWSLIRSLKGPTKSDWLVVLEGTCENRFSIAIIYLSVSPILDYKLDTWPDSACDHICQALATPKWWTNSVHLWDSGFDQSLNIRFVLAEAQKTLMLKPFYGLYPIYSFIIEAILAVWADSSGGRWEEKIWVGETKRKEWMRDTKQKRKV